MKVQDFAYQVSVRTMDLLENTQHYKINENHRKEVLAAVLKEIDLLIQKSSAPHKDNK
jgi:CRISPR/Cas system-associated exonuclease Cas4 (RecB family)